MSRFGKELDKFAATFLGAYKQSADAANTRERNRLYAENIAVDNAAAARRADIAEQNAHALQNHYANMDANSRAAIGNNAIRSSFNDYISNYQIPFQNSNPVPAGKIPAIESQTSEIPEKHDASGIFDDYGIPHHAQGGLVKSPLHHVAGEAMSHIQNRYALHAATGGAITDSSQRQQLEAFHNNARAISPEMFEALNQKTGSTEESMRQLYDFYNHKGDKSAAREAASGVMEAARAKSMALGQQSLDAINNRDYPAAAKSLMAAYNHIPDDHTFTGEVNENGIGKAVIANNHTGKPVQQLDLNPPAIIHAAKTIASGAGFYPHMAMAVRSARPPSEPVARAFPGGLMSQGVSSAIGDEDLVEPAIATEEDIPDVQTASSEGTTPSALPSGNAGYKLIPPQPWMNKAELMQLNRMNNNILAQQRLAAPQINHDINKAHDDPSHIYHTTKDELYKKYSGYETDKQAQAGLRNELMDAGVRLYNTRTPRRKPFELSEDDDQAETRFSKRIKPYTSELDALEGLGKETGTVDKAIGAIGDFFKGKKDTSIKRSDGSVATNPYDPAVNKLTPAQRDEFMDVVNSVQQYATGLSPREVVRTLHQLAYNPLVKPKFDDRVGQFNVGGVYIPLESKDYSRLSRLNTEARQRYHNEQRVNKSNERLGSEVAAQRAKYDKEEELKRREGMNYGTPYLDDSAALPNYGELPGFDPEARLGVR